MNANCILENNEKQTAIKEVHKSFHLDAPAQTSVPSFSFHLNGHTIFLLNITASIDCKFTNDSVCNVFFLQTMLKRSGPLSKGPQKMWQLRAH